MIRFASVSILAALMMAPCASAHRVGIPVTTIDWNARTEVWEVVHRVSAHDLEKYFSGRADLNTLYDTPEGVAMLGAYTASAFDVAGAEVELSYVGAELDRDQVWIYYEMRAPDQTIQVDSNLLFGSGETSFALVNVKGQGAVQSLIFAATDGPKAVRLQHE